jgi:hypothetical protein
MRGRVDEESAIHSFVIHWHQSHVSLLRHSLSWATLFNSFFLFVICGMAAGLGERDSSGGSRAFASVAFFFLYFALCLFFIVRNSRCFCNSCTTMAASFLLVVTFVRPFVCFLDAAAAVGFLAAWGFFFSCCGGGWLHDCFRCRWFPTMYSFQTPLAGFRNSTKIVERWFYVLCVALSPVSNQTLPGFMCCATAGFQSNTPCWLRIVFATTVFATSGFKRDMPFRNRCWFLPPLDESNQTPLLPPPVSNEIFRRQRLPFRNRCWFLLPLDESNQAPLAGFRNSTKIVFATSGLK